MTSLRLRVRLQCHALSTTPPEARIIRAEERVWPAAAQRKKCPEATDPRGAKDSIASGAIGRGQDNRVASRPCENAPEFVSPVSGPRASVPLTSRTLMTRTSRGTGRNESSLNLKRAGRDCSGWSRRLPDPACGGNIEASPEGVNTDFKPDSRFVTTPIELVRREPAAREWLGKEEGRGMRGEGREMKDERFASGVRLARFLSLAPHPSPLLLHLSSPPLQRLLSRRTRRPEAKPQTIQSPSGDRRTRWTSSGAVRCQTRLPPSSTANN